MGAIEELQRDCGYCRQPITLKWKDGPMPSGRRVLMVVDQVFHDRCWSEVLGHNKRFNEARLARINAVDCRSRG